jgi:hypothetical protein
MNVIYFMAIEQATFGVNRSGELKFLLPMKKIDKLILEP